MGTLLGTRKKRIRVRPGGGHVRGGRDRRAGKERLFRRGPTGRPHPHPDGTDGTGPLDTAPTVRQARDFARQNETLALQTPDPAPAPAPARDLGHEAFTFPELPRGVLRRRHVRRAQEDLGRETGQDHPCAVVAVAAFELSDALESRDERKTVLAALGERIEETRNRPQGIELVEDEPQAPPRIGALRERLPDQKIDPGGDERTKKREGIVAHREEQPPAPLTRPHPGSTTERVSAALRIEGAQGRKIRAQDRPNRGGHPLGAGREEAGGGRPGGERPKIPIGRAEEKIEEPAVRAFPPAPQSFEDGGEKRLRVVMPLLPFPVPGGDERAGETGRVVPAPHLGKRRPGDASRVERIEEAIPGSGQGRPGFAAQIENDRPITSPAKGPEESLDDGALAAPGTAGDQEVVGFEPGSETHVTHADPWAEDITRPPRTERRERFSGPRPQDRAGGFRAAEVPPLRAAPSRGPTTNENGKERGPNQGDAPAAGRRKRHENTPGRQTRIPPPGREPGERERRVARGTVDPEDPDHLYDFIMPLLVRRSCADSLGTSSARWRNRSPADPRTRAPIFSNTSRLNLFVFFHPLRRTE